METVRLCICGKVLPPNRQRFCSPECLAESMRKPARICALPDCQLPVSQPNKTKSLYCSMAHFNAHRVMRNRGAVETPLNSVPLTQGKYALVDAEDWLDVSRFTWCAVKSRPNARGELFYAVRSDSGGYLHRYLMQAKDDEQVDHHDGDGLNCRRSNLRLTDKFGNSSNKLVISGKISGFKGVHSTPGGKWVVRYMRHGTEEYGGTFEDKEEAARVYDEIIRRYADKMATYNFPRTGERSALTGEIVE